MRNGTGQGKAAMVVLPKGTSVKNYGYYTSASGVKWLYVQVTYNTTTISNTLASAAGRISKSSKLDMNNAHRGKKTSSMGVFSLIMILSRCT